MPNAAWRMSGEFIESCNCDYLCPCIFTNPQAPVTHDHCTVAQIYRIDKGTAGETSLDGLKFALVFRSRKVMAEGHWIFGAIIDESANAEQRAALTPIATGLSGGAPGFVRDHLVGEFRGVEYRPIILRAKGHERSADIPGMVSFAIEGVLSTNHSGEPYYLDNTSHPANRRLALARSTETHFHAFGLDVDLAGQGNNGYYAPFDWQG
jgi:hypothetical protein